MSNPDAIQDGQGDYLDPIQDLDGVVYLKGAGDSFTVAGAGDLGASQMVQLMKAGIATHSNVSGANASTLLLAAAPARKGVSIWNDSAAILYLKYATGASATSCFVKLIADAYWEMPVIWTGVVYGFWASATGAARIVELT